MIGDSSPTNLGRSQPIGGNFVRKTLNHAHCTSAFARIESGRAQQQNDSDRLASPSNNSLAACSYFSQTHPADLANT
jgi:hypothetical protein